MSLKMFRFRIENMRTKETTAFIGQGETILEAIKDSVTSVNEQFRPKNDGKQRPAVGVMVTLPNGEIVNKQLKEFESDGSAKPEEMEFE